MISTLPDGSSTPQSSGVIASTAFLNTEPSASRSAGMSSSSTLPDSWTTLSNMNGRLRFQNRHSDCSSRPYARPCGSSAMMEPLSNPSMRSLALSFPRNENTVLSSYSPRFAAASTSGSPFMLVRPAGETTGVPVNPCTSM